MANKFKIKFQETREIDFEMDFHEIYDFVKKDIILDGSEFKPTKWDVCNYFGDNIEFYIQKIYNYDIENNDYNDYTVDYIFKEWGNWIENNVTE